MSPRSPVVWLGLCLMASAALAQAPTPTTNPWRGQAEAIARGQGLFNGHCAVCHGVDASTPSAEAPDLRRLDAFCRPLADPAWQQRCLSDVDRYFLDSAQEGKVRAGVRYMPAWAGVLSTEDLWAIRSFIAARPVPPPRTHTSVDRAAGH